MRGTLYKRPVAGRRALPEQRLAGPGQKDKGQLLISEYQARQALDLARKAHVRLALYHHPLAWLRDWDEKVVRAVLSGPDYCHFLLSGHLHDIELGMRAGPAFQTAELAAGACWQDAGWPHSVTLGQLDLSSRKMHLHVFTYSAWEGGFWARDNQLSRALPEGIWSHSFPEEWTIPSPGDKPVVKTMGPLVPGLSQISAKPMRQRRRSGGDGSAPALQATVHLCWLENQLDGATRKRTRPGLIMVPDLT